MSPFLINLANNKEKCESVDPKPHAAFTDLEYDLYIFSLLKFAMSRCLVIFLT